MDTNGSHRCLSAILSPWLAAVGGMYGLGCAKGVNVSRSDSERGNPSSVQAPGAEDPSNPPPSDPRVKGPKGTPTEVPHALGLARSQVQTRGSILLPITQDQSQTYEALELVHETTGQTIVATALGRDVSSPLASETSSTLAATSEYVLASVSDSARSTGLGDGPDLMLRLLPISLTSLKRLNYGSNHLKLTLTGHDRDIIASRHVVIRDFSYFGLGTASFADGRWRGQERVQGYQGRASMAVGLLQRSGSTELHTGSLTILHH